VPVRQRGSVGVEQLAHAVVGMSTEIDTFTRCRARTADHLFVLLQGHARLPTRASAKALVAVTSPASAC